MANPITLRWFRASLRSSLPAFLVLAVILAGCAEESTPQDDDTTDSEPQGEEDSEPQGEEDNEADSEPQGEADAESVTLRLGHIVPEGHPYDVAGSYVAERVAELTDGAVQIELHRGATLGSEVETLDLYRSGDMDLGLHFYASVATAVPELGYLGAPYLFADQDHWTAVMHSPDARDYWQSVLDEANPGFRIGAIGSVGERNIYTKDRRLESIEDFAGLKMRVAESEVMAESWRTVGIEPVVLPFGDIYSGLQAGLIEAAENSPQGYYVASHQEVATLYNLTQHEVATAFLLVGDHVYEQLDAEGIEALETALEEVHDVWLEASLDADSTIAGQFDADGVEVIEVPAEVRSEIASGMEAVRESFAADWGLEDFQQMVDAAAN